MTNESSKTTVISAILTSAIAVLIPQTISIISTNVQLKKLNQEIKTVQNSQTYIIDNISETYCDQKYIASEYEVNVNIKPINLYANNTYSSTRMSNKIAGDSNISTSDYSVPTCDTSFKAYMDYRCITDDTTKQWEIQQNAWTDNDGFRRVNNDYIVAMGTYYTKECGERFRITFDSGSEITVTVGDIKQDCHTDYLNRYTPVYDENGIFYSGNVLEFIVDTNVLSEMSQVLGTVGHHDYLDGNIKSIERIES